MTKLFQSRRDFLKMSGAAIATVALPAAQLEAFAPVPLPVIDPTKIRPVQSYRGVVLSILDDVTKEWQPLGGVESSVVQDERPVDVSFLGHPIRSAQRLVVGRRTAEIRVHTPDFVWAEQRLLLDARPHHFALCGPDMSYQFEGALRTAELSVQDIHRYLVRADIAIDIEGEVKVTFESGGAQ